MGLLVEEVFEEVLEEVFDEVADEVLDEVLVDVGVAEDLEMEVPEGFGRYLIPLDEQEDDWPTRWICQPLAFGIIVSASEKAYREQLAGRYR